MVPGAVLKGRYKLSRLPLAHKGMGEVWPAQDTLLDRPVIVKLVSGVMSDVDLLRRFRREALLTARLDHPGVPAVYDLGEHSGHPYLVLQRINGLTLTDLLAEQGPLPVEWVAAIGAQISSVLLAAGQIGLVHRDIKPSNVMLDTSGAIKVLDFGLAAIHDDDRYSRITQSGQSLGTLGYMAPEQVLGEPVDHRTDLYGLGATLFDLITGCPPFGDVSTTAMLRHQMEDAAPRPAQLRPEVPAVLDDLVAALMAIRPEDRPANAAEVYPVLAPLCQDLSPIPGLFDHTAAAVQAYAAIVGGIPYQNRSLVDPVRQQPEFNAEQALRDAERSYAAREFRAAARQWRRLAEHHAQQHGDDSRVVFDLRLRAAQAHVALGEHDRALRQMQTLLEQRIRVDGAEHPVVAELRQEIELLNGKRPSAPRFPGDTPGADR